MEPEHKLQLFKTLNDIKDKLFSDVEVAEIELHIMNGDYTTHEQVESHPVK